MEMISFLVDMYDYDVVDDNYRRGRDQRKRLALATEMKEKVELLL